MTTPVTLHLPENWTAQQALDVYEILHELAIGIWDQYETPIIELIADRPRDHDPAQLDLLDFDDKLPF